MSKNIKILVADDDPQMQLAIKATLARAGYDVTMASNGRQALELSEADQFELIITDQRMPELGGQELLRELQTRGSRVPVIMITAYGTINQAVEAMQLGAADFITKPFSGEELERVIERVLSPESRELRAKPKRGARGRPIVTNDPLMIRVLEVCEAVARSDATVLINGESGTGKELIARLIHASSARSNQPFVAVNCAALPDTLLESELFGHEKGSFTGAQARKIGKFELAHGGTILLDEISEMDLNLQAKLLRVLQEREVDRVGGRDPISIDVRVLATTNRVLEECVADGSFRADLYYRLNVIPVALPPLRARPGDIGLLINHFMQQYLGDAAPQLPNELLQRLRSYPWPGNVRELQNAVERAAILCRGEAFKESDFLLNNKSNSIINRPDEAVASAQATSDAVSNSGSELIRPGRTVHEVEKSLILETLRQTDNNRTQAAKLLGISIRTLRNKLSEYRGAPLED